MFGLGIHSGNGFLVSSKFRIAFLYSFFAGIALVSNLFSQALFVRYYHGLFEIEISVLVGTAVGLPIKYVLDKKYIFLFKADSVLHDSKLFILYGAMALVTTSIFWGFEALFQFIFQNEMMRLLGGGIGLVIGYLIKYQLDKKYVFRENGEFR